MCPRFAARALKATRVKNPGCPVDQYHDLSSYYSTPREVGWDRDHGEGEAGLFGSRKVL
jgi:hypothetical protein